LILERSNRGFVERVSRALIASIGCAEITLNATNAGVFNDLPKNQKLKLSRRETRSTSTTIHQKKKSKNASKVRNFLIRPPKASQSLTSAQRTSLENFGLQKGMIRRATYLYFWWRSNLVPASFPKNFVSSYFNLSFVIDSHEKIDIIRN
jgi:hypothetical protein